MTRLALIRHGQSEWNLENRFTGWVDVDLTDNGRAEAAKAGNTAQVRNILEVKVRSGRASNDRNHGSTAA